MSSISGKCPCINCVAPRRHPGCHSFCEDYIPWRKELTEIKEKERAAKQVEVMLDLMKKDSVDRTKKSNKVKRRFHHK